MAYLLDTSILVRLANASDVQHAIAARAVLELHRRSEVLHITPQVLIEFRSVASRPIALNGAGLSIVDVETLTTTFETKFPLLVETPDIFANWKAIVAAIGMIGKQVHDARLVAVCHAHAVSHLLTFNVTHFARMGAIGPGIIVVDPAKV